MWLKRQIIVGLSLLILSISGCMTRGVYVPVSSAGVSSEGKGKVHIVTKGETLYSIAFRYGLDYRHVAVANGIKPPYTIYVNQKINLTRGHSENLRAPQKSVKKKSRKSRRISQSQKSQPSNIKWHWPLDGEVINGFDLTGNVNKGVDIRGRLGESVNSAADGVVVYAGGGLRGYGKLVIVKHNDRFLSAYGHNRAILVKEGDKVKGGQVVAEIGSSGADQEILHFEIRRDGKPEDPMIYLPNRRGKL